MVGKKVSRRTRRKQGHKEEFNCYEIAFRYKTSIDLLLPVFTGLGSGSNDHISFSSFDKLRIDKVCAQD
jgi:hypothetical protein